MSGYPVIYTYLYAEASAHPNNWLQERMHQLLEKTSRTPTPNAVLSYIQLVHLSVQVHGFNAKTPFYGLAAPFDKVVLHRFYAAYKVFFTFCIIHHKKRCMFRLYLHFWIVCRFLLPFCVLRAQKATNASAEITFLAGLVPSPAFDGVRLPNPCIMASKRHVLY